MVGARLDEPEGQSPAPNRASLKMDIKFLWIDDD